MYQEPNRNGQYDYSFRSEPYTNRTAGNRGGNGGFVKLFLTVVLCVAVSFAAGAGGAYYVYRNLMDTQEASVMPPPSGDSLLNSDPEGLLSRSDTVYSPYGSAGEDAYAISEVVRIVEDSVVVINTKTLTTNMLGRPTEVDGGAGSGVIIAAEGYILTCHHVVDGASSVTVRLNNGRSYAAVLVGSDETSDLAVLKIEPLESEPLTAAKHGKSGYLVTGERVVAIGNPLGTLGGTVTDGIISATERQVTTSNGVMTLLQTNAAINSGNSGGGLFNLKGELVGIVNAKYAASGVEGLAFAIPIDSAYEVECDLIEHGYRRGIIDHGLTFVEINDDNYSYYHYKFDIQAVGLYIEASKLNTDLKNKDRILSVNGKTVLTQSDFESAIAESKVGDVLTIEYERSGSKLQTTLTLQEYVPDSLVEFS